MTNSDGCLTGGCMKLQMTVFYGEVSAVDEEARTCTVVMEDVPYENVLLYAVEKAELKGLVSIPKIGSTVLVERMANDRYLW